MRRFAGYPRIFYPVLLLAFSTLVGTGVLLLPHMMTMRLDWNAAFEVAGEVRLASAAVHCAIAFLVLFLLGELASLHMRVGWHRRQNRVSGVTLAILFVLLSLTAVGIYYFGDERLSRWSSLIHSVAGLMLVAVVLWHGVVGHQLYNRRHNRHALRQHRRRGRDAYPVSEAQPDFLREG